MVLGHLKMLAYTIAQASALEREFNSHHQLIITGVSVEVISRLRLKNIF